MYNTIIILLAEYLYLLIALIAVAFLWFLPKAKKIESVIILIIAISISLILVLILSHYIIDPRPFVVNNVTPLLPHAPDNGFPSDHTLVSMLAALLVFFFSKKIGSILIALAVIVGVARILAHLHHPLDIIGSIIIALTSFLGALLIYRKITIIKN
jgi:undecaprenyl-diphosphatase